MKRVVLVSLLALVACLSGCVAFDLVNAVGVIAPTTASDLIAKEDYVAVTQTLGDVSTAEYVANAGRKDRDCTFNALMVPYDRTWPEHLRQGDDAAVLPPDPAKIAGYIAVVYQKVCPNQVAQKILRAGRQTTSTGMGPPLHRFGAETTYFRKLATFALSTQDMADPARHETPQWWPQVVDRLIRVAASRPEVKGALAFDQQLFIQSAPEQADAIEAAIR